MLRRIVDIVVHLVAAGAFVAGMVFLLMAFIDPIGIHGYGASAVQITQVYSEAIYFAVIGSSLFLFAALLELVVYTSKANTAKANDYVVANIEETNQLLRQIGRMLSEQ